MITIQTNSTAEKKIVDLHLRKLRLEGNLEELNRSIGYMQQAQFNQRKIALLRELDNIETLLDGKQPILSPDQTEGIKQYMVTIQ